MAGFRRVLAQIGSWDSRIGRRHQPHPAARRQMWTCCATFKPHLFARPAMNDESSYASEPPKGYDW